MSDASTKREFPVVTQAKDKVAEWLLRRNATFRGPIKVPLTNIDERKSRANQARDIALDQQHVETLIVSRRAGNQFEPAVGYLDTGGRVVLIDGNHRHETEKKVGGRSLDTYVLDPTTASELIAALTVEANAMNGLNTPMAWRMGQAVHLITAYGYSLDAAAEFARVKKTTLSTHYKAIKAAPRAKLLGIGSAGWADLPVSSRAKLDQIPDDSVFRAATRLTIEAKLSTADVNSLVQDVRAQKSEAERLRVVEKLDETKTLEKATATAMKDKEGKFRAPKMALLSALGKIQHVDLSMIPDNFKTPEEKQKLLARVYEALKMLGEIEAIVTRKDRDRAAS